MPGGRCVIVRTSARAAVDQRADDGVVRRMGPLLSLRRARRRADPERASCHDPARGARDTDVSAAPVGGGPIGFIEEVEAGEMTGAMRREAAGHDPDARRRRPGSRAGVLSRWSRAAERWHRRAGVRVRRRRILRSAAGAEACLLAARSIARDTGSPIAARAYRTDDWPQRQQQGGGRCRDGGGRAADARSSRAADTSGVATPATSRIPTGICGRSLGRRTCWSTSEERVAAFRSEIPHAGRDEPASAGLLSFP